MDSIIGWLFGILLHLASLAGIIIGIRYLISYIMSVINRKRTIKELCNRIDEIDEKVKAGDMDVIDAIHESQRIKRILCRDYGIYVL